MAKKKITSLLSLLVLPNIFSVLSYTKEGSIDYSLQTKNVKQDLQQLVEKALKDLKNPIDFSKSFLIENDDFKVDIIENEFINVLTNQLEQKDERLSIKLVTKNQNLLNNNKINIEVIGKNDNEEIRKTTHITPIKLLTIKEYINTLKNEIHITVSDRLFAWHEKFNPPYEKEAVNNKIKAKFIGLNNNNNNNNNKLQKRNIIEFDLVVDADSSNTIKFQNGNNVISVSIKLEYNKSSTKINLVLLDVEKHPETALNEIADIVNKDGLDLSNEPIFEDSEFGGADVQRKIWDILNFKKDVSSHDKKDDILLKLAYIPVECHGRLYSVVFWHKKPEIINSISISTYRYINVKNVRENPNRQTKFISILEYFDKKCIYINTGFFNLLCKYKAGDVLNLENTNSDLNAHLDARMKAAVDFETLSMRDQQNTKFVAKRIASIDSHY